MRVQSYSRSRSSSGCPRRRHHPPVSGWQESWPVAGWPGVESVAMELGRGLYEMERYAVIGLVILVLSFLTQLIKIWRTGRVRGISAGAMWQVVLCSLLFSGYYLGLGHFLALALNVLLLIITLAILTLYYKHRDSDGIYYRRYL